MTSRGNRLRGIALVVGVGLVLAGCEKSTDGVPTSSGQSSASSTAKPSGSKDADAAIWDPCIALPDEALQASGLSLETRTKDVAGVDPTGWKACSWRSSARWYTLAVLSGDVPLEQFQQRPDYEAFTPVTVGSRKGVRFLKVGDDKRLTCSVAVEIPQGSKAGTVSFLVNTRLSVGKLGEPCDEAQRHANDFAKFLP
ncbi:DUF3558 domain-containing protein [Nocardia suismassiliense]|uniref:DUF3558 domain-containing protein n=1 Tax=Nocardia suismassiliense TaxID=2077092 RepID=UPI00131EF57D|nr:DUF3558 domain-containing protein [Nocardia suismassiliense]